MEITKCCVHCCNWLLCLSLYTSCLVKFTGTSRTKYRSGLLLQTITEGLSSPDDRTNGLVSHRKSALLSFLISNGNALKEGTAFLHISTRNFRSADTIDWCGLTVRDSIFCQFVSFFLDPLEQEWKQNQSVFNTNLIPLHLFIKMTPCGCHFKSSSNKNQSGYLAELYVCNKFHKCAITEKQMKSTSPFCSSFR